MPVYVSPDQRQKALRIYARALPLIADAVGLGTKALHNNVLRRVLFDDLAAIESGEAVPPAEPVVAEAPSSDLGDTLHNSDHPEGAENEVALANPLPEQQVAKLRNLEKADFIKPEPAPMMQMRPASQVSFDEKVATGLVTLRNAAGDYLNLDGSGVTTNRAHAYRGTTAQAKAMRKQSELARRFTISHFTQKSEISR